MQLDWETYKRALKTLVSITTTNHQFERKVFNISSLQVVRQSLSVHDGKRYILPDGIHTHAFGFPKIEELQRLLSLQQFHECGRFLSEPEQLELRKLYIRK